MDYSGSPTEGVREGLTLMDHPKNVGHPSRVARPEQLNRHWDEFAKRDLHPSFGPPRADRECRTAVTANSPQSFASTQQCFDCVRKHESPDYVLTSNHRELCLNRTTETTLDTALAHPATRNDWLHRGQPLAAIGTPREYLTTKFVTWDHVHCGCCDDRPEGEIRVGCFR
jgi:hypothetical protein